MPYKNSEMGQETLVFQWLPALLQIARQMCTADNGSRRRR